MGRLVQLGINQLGERIVPILNGHETKMLLDGLLLGMQLDLQSDPEAMDCALDQSDPRATKVTFSGNGYHATIILSNQG